MSEAGGERAVWVQRASTAGHGGSSVRVLVAGEDTAGRFAVLETLEGQGAALPGRVHTREDQAVYVLEGLVSYRVDGAWRRCPAGTCVLLPKGCEYAYAVESERARLLVVAAPAGIEGCYLELAAAGGVPHPAAPDFERLVTVAARYGVEIALPGAQTGAGQRGASMERG